GRQSFKALVARYSNEPRSAPILDELLRVNAVRRLGDGRLEALSRSYATVRWKPHGIEALGEELREHGATLLHNLEHPGQPRYGRRIVNAQLAPRYLPLLRRDIEDQFESVADVIEDALNERAHTVTPAPGGRDAVRLGVEIYVFEEPVILEPGIKEKGS